uniref:DUF3782 domain-containing protein n=2 Tax=Candidatus Kentrum sp. LFY TaxID=2126342 RepID=A0A450WIH0_9GAMM|nr:MAG: hypothetical protein BECKLFY1418C_GA0070996_102619 [Candidatus Kentron sp. LFY]
MSTITYEEVLSLLRETDQLIKDQSREADRRFKENALESKETDRRLKELEHIVREQSRQIDKQTRQIDKQTYQIEKQGQQIGGIGDKFGYFTEGMALPSMERILMERFKMTFIMPRVRIRKNGKTIEIDVLAYANDDVDLAVVVEVKSRVKNDAIEQLRKLMAQFREFYPEHRGKGLVGILAGVDWDRGIAEKAREVGFSTAAIRDEIFELTAPEGFEARRW